MAGSVRQREGTYAKWFDGWLAAYQANLSFVVGPFIKNPAN